MNDNHRTRSVAHTVLADRTEQHARKLATSSTADDQKLRICCDIEENGCRPALPDDYVDVGVGAEHFLDGPLQGPPSVPPGIEVSGIWRHPTPGDRPLPSGYDVQG
jgi:hypothetical protein